MDSSRRSIYFKQLPVTERNVDLWTFFAVLVLHLEKNNTSVDSAVKRIARNCQIFEPHWDGILVEPGVRCLKERHKETKTG